MTDERPANNAAVLYSTRLVGAAECLRDTPAIRDTSDPRTVLDDLANTCAALADIVGPLLNRAGVDAEQALVGIDVPDFRGAFAAAEVGLRRAVEIHASRD